MNRALAWIVPLIFILGVIAAGIGIFSQGGEGSYTYETVHGQTVEMFGSGLYKNDSLFFGAAFRGADAVTLLVSLPLLAIFYLLSRRGSQKSLIAMLGVLFFFLYYSASLTFSAAFNTLFLVYTALFSVSLFAVIIALTTFDMDSLEKGVLPGFPHRGMAIFMLVAGFGTMFLWLSELMEPLTTGQAPTNLGPYTTMFTHGFDLAIITPAAALTGIFLLQRKPLGYLLAAPILILCTLIGIVVIAQTISQTLEGIVFPIGVYIGMVGSWIIMGAFAIGMTISFFRNLSTTKAGVS